MMNSAAEYLTSGLFQIPQLYGEAIHSNALERILLRSAEDRKEVGVEA